MFGCRRFTTSRRGVQTMASHLQATAGGINRAQQKTLPTAQTAYSPVDEFTQSVARSLNVTINDAAAFPQMSTQPVEPLSAVPHVQALSGNEYQQPVTTYDSDAQRFGARISSSRCQACSTGEAAAERARSWYGQRVWARVPAAPSAAPSISTISQGAPQAAPGAHGAGVGGAGGDVAMSANVVPQPQAWRFSVMCFNILADTYAQYFSHKLYGDVPRHYLDWHHRLSLLVEEVRYWAPDIVCLQEVQHYQELELELRAAGYEGRFMRRTGRRRDGCATFWRADRLRACSIQRLDFAPLGLEDNVAMLLSLTPRWEAGGGQGLDRQTAEALSAVRLLVATTHITFDPAKGDVKLGQVRTLLSRAASLATNPPAENRQLDGAGSYSNTHSQQHSCGHQHHQHQHGHRYASSSSSSSASNSIAHGSEHRDMQQEQQLFQQRQQESSHQQQQQQQQQQSSNPGPGQIRGSHNPHPTHHRPQAAHPPKSCSIPEAASAGPGMRSEEQRSASASSPTPASATSSATGVEGRRRKAPAVPRTSSFPRDGPHGAAAVAGVGGQQQVGQDCQQPQQPLQTLAIITGDFNSTAGSPLYQFVAQGSLDLARTNRKKLSGQLHGVCHTQYKPVSEVKQLHAQLTAGSASAAIDRREVTSAKPAAPASAAGDLAADTPVVTAVGISSPLGTPPSTPFVAAVAADAQGTGAASGTKASVGVTQRIATAAMESAAAAISACTAAAIAAASHPVLASPVSRAVAACKVLDNFLHSAAAASGTHRLGGERWSEKELRNAMGDQYDVSAVPRAITSSRSCVVLPPSAPAMAASTSLPAIINDRADDSSEQQQQPPLKLGRQHSPPPVNRLSLEGSRGDSDAGVAAGANSPCRSLNADLGGVTAAVAAVEPPSLAGPAPGPLVVRHPLRLKSSYVEVARAEPAFTSIHSGFMGTVDFIWYTTDPILQQQEMLRDQQQQVKASVDVYAEAALEPEAVAPPPPPSPHQGEGPALPHVSVQGTPSVSAVEPGESGAMTFTEMAPVVVPCGDHGIADSVSAQQLPQPQPQSCSQPLHGGCSAAAAAAASTSGAAANSTAAHATASEAAGVAGRRFQLVPVAVLQPPDLELLPRGLPAAGWGSDHISIMTEFELRPV